MDRILLQKDNEEPKYRMNLTESEALEVLFYRRPEPPLLKFILKIIGGGVVLLAVLVGVWYIAENIDEWVAVGLGLLVAAPVIFLHFKRGRRIRDEDTATLNKRYLKV